MRVFLAAAVATILLGACGYFLLDALQKPTGVAFVSDSARIEPAWNWRTGFTASIARSCENRKTWQWFFVDFGRPKGEPSACSDFQ